MSEARIAGHFGEWLQGTLGSSGPIVLVTLPCPALAVTVRWRPAEALVVRGAAACLLPVEAAARLLRCLDLDPAGEAEVVADMPAGGGAGGSTASLLALARAAGGAIPAGRLAAACLAAEGASDPLMLAAPDRHLWASREGRSLARLPAVPGFDIVGGFFGTPLRTNPADMRHPDIADLVAPWRTAAAAANHAALARIASVSAARTTALRGPPEDPTADLAAACGALGHVRAHTGSARGLIFAPGTAPDDTENRLRAAGYDRVFSFRTGAR